MGVDLHPSTLTLGQAVGGDQRLDEEFPCERQLAPVPRQDPFEQVGSEGEGRQPRGPGQLHNLLDHTRRSREVALHDVEVREAAERSQDLLVTAGYSAAQLQDARCHQLDF